MIDWKKIRVRLRASTKATIIFEIDVSKIQSVGT